MSFLMAFCHELSHLLLALYLGEECQRINIMPYGCSLYLKPSKSPIKEFFIALAGPLFNLIMMCITKKGALFDINAAMLIINLIPILPLDGGRMLWVILSAFLSGMKTDYLMAKLSLFLGALVLILGIYQAYLTGFNFSLFLAGSFLLISAFFDMGKERRYAKILTEKKSIKKPLKAVELVVEESTPAHHVIPYLMTFKYNFLSILDKEGRVKMRIGEETLLEEISSSSPGINMGEIAIKELRKKV